MSRAPTPLEGGSRRALIGGALWGTGLLIVSPSPFDTAWATALLLLAPLALVPLALDLAGRDGLGGRAARLWHLAALLQLPSALCLGAASLLPQGPAAAGLALPWLGTTGLIALCGLLRLRQYGIRSLDELCIDAGLVYIVVGGAWAVSDRMGYRPLDFDAVIVLLTAIHFHYAGFVLPIITGLILRESKGGVARAAGITVVAGVPLVAVGITATQLGAGSLIECLAAWVMATGGTLTAYLLLRLALRRGQPLVVRCLWVIAAISLFGSMVLAALYGTRFYVSVQWLDIPWMRALHGTANALGFGLAGLVAWTFARRGAEDQTSSDTPPDRSA